MANQKIIIASNDRVYLDMMHEALLDEGYCIHCVADAYALDAIRCEQPALIMLDINSVYPCAGWWLLEQIRLDQATAYTPVLICSTDAHFSLHHEAQLREQRCEFLEKPFLFEALCSKIGVAIGPPNNN